MILSFIVPIFNTKAVFLEKCIDSLTRQTCTFNYEIILVNDGSTETETIDFLSRCHNPKLNILYKKNGGVSNSRNKGLELAKGKYISFVDADDFLELNFLESIENDLNNDLDVIYLNNDLLINNKIKHKNINNLNVVWAKIFKKDFLIKNNINFDENISFCEDFIFMQKVFACQKKYKHLEKPLYIYRQNEFNSSNKFDEKCVIEFNKSLISMEPYLTREKFVTNCFMIYLSYVLPKAVFNKKSKLRYTEKKKKATEILYNEKLCYRYGLNIKKESVNKIRFFQFILIKHKLFAISNYIGKVLTLIKKYF